MTLPKTTKYWIIGLCIGLIAGVGTAWFMNGPGEDVKQPQAQSAAAPEVQQESPKAPAHEDMVTDLAPGVNRAEPEVLPLAKRPDLGPTPQQQLVKKSYSDSGFKAERPRQWTKPLALPEVDPTPPDPNRKPELWVDISRTVNPPKNPIDVGDYTPPSRIL